MFASIWNVNPIQREFEDLQNLTQDLQSFGRFCGPQTLFAWDLDSMSFFEPYTCEISLPVFVNHNQVAPETPEVL